MVKIPENYTPSLGLYETQKAIGLIKNVFLVKICAALHLKRVTAPLFVDPSTGLNDDLNGVERPVTFDIKEQNGRTAEVVQSLAKWKRYALKKYGFSYGEGLYTDMNAIRRDEITDNIHSIFVDQWDWERTVTAEQRNLDFLKEIVTKIYGVVRRMEREVYEIYPHITPILPETIRFIQSEDLLKMYPSLSPRERETEAARKYGAIFVIGIGGKLSDGKKHDGRAPDYDDWTTPSDGGYKGLNGDIILWNPVLESAFEVSSMGIRVDKTALLRQLELDGCPERADLEFHKALLEDRIPLSIGGGIGQSRLCMFLLRCAHIGEVQASIWPEEMVETCRKHNIYLK